MWARKDPLQIKDSQVASILAPTSAQFEFSSIQVLETGWTNLSSKEWSQITVACSTIS